LRTTTVEYEDLKVTLARPTLATATLRRKLYVLLNEGRDDTTSVAVYCYYITQLVEGIGISDQRLTALPDKATVDQMFNDWCERTDELLAEKLAGAINILAGRDTDEKKGLSAPSSTTS
jgi:hypothetical protein